MKKKNSQKLLLYELIKNTAAAASALAQTTGNIARAADGAALRHPPSKVYKPLRVVVMWISDAKQMEEKAFSSG